MKKITLLSLLSLFAISLITAQTVPLSVIKRNGQTISATTHYLNPAQIENVQWTDSTCIVSYANIENPNPKAIGKYTVTQPIDTVWKYANKYTAELVKVNISSKVAKTTRDTITQWLFPIRKITEVRSASIPGQTTARARLFVQQLSNFDKIYIYETPSVLAARIDSVLAAGTNVSSTSVDTSNYTQKITDGQIILNSTTADTLTLLNPSQFATREPIVVVNIGSGDYTLAGGFTVKDKSGSNVTSLAANTVYTFKAYYNGSAYIWLKEY